MHCIKCGNEKDRVGISKTFLCDTCFDKQKSSLTQLDVETYDEDRLVFLVRVSKQLGLNHTLDEIKKMINEGYSDNLILKNEKYSIWTYGVEPSKALPYVHKE